MLQVREVGGHLDGNPNEGHYKEDGKMDRHTPVRGGELVNYLPGHGRAGQAVGGGGGGGGRVSN